jgi:H+/gluconate symporter-like permease
MEALNFGRNVLKTSALAAALLVGSTSMAATGTTVINRDAKAHVLLVEDEDENITEMAIAAGATLTSICKNECFISLKGTEEFEYVDTNTAVVFAIIDGILTVDDAD